MDVSLQGLQQWYAETLCDRFFVFTLKNGNQIKLIFEPSDFAHLLGIHHVSSDRDHKGTCAWDLIAQNKITVESLKKANKNDYKQIRERIRLFYEIENILRDGVMRDYKQMNVHGRTTIQANFVLYLEGQEKIVHLFIRQQSDKSNVYKPISFIIKSLKDRDPWYYIGRQAAVHLQSREVILL